MDTNNQIPNETINSVPPTPQQEKKVGPIVGALIIILVLIIAGLYFFGQKLNTQNPVEEASTESAVITDESEALTATATASQSDDITTLEADLDNELKDIEYSF
ncbi:MAG TPA: hypothetical protein VJC02_01285 [Candidatus Paceibacterota bacterium]